MWGQYLQQQALSYRGRVCLVPGPGPITFRVEGGGHKVVYLWSKRVSIIGKAMWRPMELEKVRRRYSVRISPYTFWLVSGYDTSLEEVLRVVRDPQTWEAARRNGLLPCGGYSQGGFNDKHPPYVAYPTLGTDTEWRLLPPAAFQEFRERSGYPHSITFLFERQIGSVRPELEILWGVGRPLPPAGAESPDIYLFRQD